MSQWLMITAVKPNDLNSVPGTHTLKEKISSLRFSSNFHRHTMAHSTTPYICIHTYIHACMHIDTYIYMHTYIAYICA